MATIVIIVLIRVIVNSNDKKEYEIVQITEPHFVGISHKQKMDTSTLIGA